MGNYITCVDLKKQYGGRYRIENELGGHRITDPWQAVIVCRHGHLYPIGGARLGASTNHRGPVAKRLAALDCTTVVQDGDDGINVTFDVSHLRVVARIIKPRSRRRLSAEHRRKLLASNCHSRFSNGSSDHRTVQKKPIGCKPGTNAWKNDPLQSGCATVTN